MNEAAVTTTIRLAEYRPSDFLVETVTLTLRLAAAASEVVARLAIRRAPGAPPAAPLVLDGEALALRAIRLDGAELAPDRYRLDAHHLTIFDPPGEFTLETTTEIHPAANTTLSGLYVSGGNFYTQCEAEGFRRITFFPDHPDVMARYRVTLIADRRAAPILLANGNPVAQGENDDGTHWATWDDPHPKPCYLFALVAGDLIAVRDRFVTRSGKEIQLAIWVRRGDEDKTGHAMHCLKAAMAWDESRFGREYDLDVFNIAAVSDFNMGAMENKGLNIFNTRYVLARPETATDADYRGIETVISHEYFHNWTGNRITCRDWFQLSLKEGLTVFRDQEFSADLGSRALQRIQDVRRLRAVQFPEDAGPLAHPVRPAAYQKIDNFYTATVYQKGAELVRMIASLLGPQRFRAGMDRYFATCDNRAVTIEDFLAALGEGAGADLAPFLAWYATAGTPEVTLTETYDAAAETFTLHLRQRIPPTPGQADKPPLPIPLAIGLLDAETGATIAAKLAGETAAASATRHLLLDQPAQTWHFEEVARRPVAAIGRGFSAPVKTLGLTRERLRFLATHDPDPFLRWDCLQRYATETLLAAAAAWRAGAAIIPDEGLVAVIAALLDGAERDPAFVAEAITLPSETLLAEEMDEIDVDALHAARESLRAAIGRALAGPLRAWHAKLRAADEPAIDGAAMGRRALANAVLSYLVAGGGEEAIAAAVAQYRTAPTMTGRIGALTLLAAIERPEREPALADFYTTWRHDPLVLDKWFAIQAAAPLPGAPARVRALTRHPDFTPANPNRLRALIGSFAQANPAGFHDASGDGYALLAETIATVDPANPQLAARLVAAFGAWRRYPPARQALMAAALADLAARPGLSANSREMIAKILTPPQLPDAVTRH